MNQYHIYEAIGHGKCSTVYKGRKKKTIEYFACKSVDKSRKNKVLQEVRILHSLNHPNVLKFYAWYETSAHMWLVLEYCVGGDLRTLLQQVLLVVWLCFLIIYGHRFSEIHLFCRTVNCQKNLSMVLLMILS
jgi:serine/threonine protein kinase